MPRRPGEQPEGEDFSKEKEKAEVREFHARLDQWKEIEYLFLDVSSSHSDDEEFESTLNQLASQSDQIQELYSNPPYKHLMKREILNYISQLVNSDYDEKKPTKMDIRMKRVSELGLNLATKLVDQVQPDIDDGFVNIETAGNFAHRLYEKGDTDRKVKGLSLLRQNIEKIRDAGMEGNSPKPLEWLNTIIQTEEGIVTKTKVASAVIEIAEGAKSLYNRAHALSVVYEHYRDSSTISNFLEKYKLPVEEILTAWQASVNHDVEMKEKAKDEIFENFRAIETLEQFRPGSSHLLYKNCGIRDFGRYPTDLLINQFDEWDKTDLPYGIAIFPRNDWNGAFYLNKYTLGDLPDQLRGKFALRVFECESKQDIARVLISIDKKYGSKQKISLAIIGGHGQHNSILFGGKEERHKLTTTDLSGGGATKSVRFFTESPTFILASCSTGADKGIGQELSNKFKAKLIAPKIPTALMRVYASKKPGREFRFNASYLDPDTKNIYKQGLKEQKNG